MSTSFQIAAPHRNHDWDKAVAIALAPSVTAWAAIQLFTGHSWLAASVAITGFLCALVCSLLLARPNYGHIELDSNSLRIVSGRLDARFMLEHLDLDAAARTPARHGGDCTTLVTDPAKTVTIPGNGDQSVSVSPADPEAFLAALRNLAERA